MVEHKASSSKMLRYGTGEFYDGPISVECGRKDGLGRLSLAAGDEYCGMFEKGFFSGLGVLTLAVGGDCDYTYKGEFREGKYGGMGVLTTKNGVFAGKFLHGQVSCGRLEANVGRQKFTVDGLFTNGTVAKVPNQNFLEMWVKAHETARDAESVAEQFVSCQSS